MRLLVICDSCRCSALVEGTTLAECRATAETEGWRHDGRADECNRTWYCSRCSLSDRNSHERNRSMNEELRQARAFFREEAILDAAIKAEHQAKQAKRKGRAE